jgi:hypothetical protein
MLPSKTKVRSHASADAGLIREFSGQMITEFRVWRIIASSKAKRGDGVIPRLVIARAARRGNPRGGAALQNAGAIRKAVWIATGLKALAMTKNIPRRGGGQHLR